MLVPLCCACGSSSAGPATTAERQQEHLQRLLAYGSFLQSIKTQPNRTTVLHELQELERRLEVDGPTARSRLLVETASRAVMAIEVKNGEPCQSDECLNLRLHAHPLSAAGIVDHRSGMSGSSAFTAEVSATIG